MNILYLSVIQNIMSIPVYKVLTVRHYIGMRIEAYDNNCYVFTDKKKAIDYAYKRTCDYQKDLCRCWEDTNGYDAMVKVEYNDNGKYFVKDGHYDWPIYSVSIEQDELKLDEDIILSVKFDA